MSSKGNLIILSAPSGSGKTSLATRALQAIPDLRFSVSHTTRPARRGERHGVEYFFVRTATFEAMIRQDAFLEFAHVYGNYYGTTRGFVELELAAGRDVLLDIDVQGALKVKKQTPEAVMIFVLPPSYETLRERLKNRGLDDESVIEKRLEIARQEIEHFAQYGFVIINRDIDQSLFELKSIIWAARCRLSRRQEEAARILETFHQRRTE